MENNKSKKTASLLPFDVTYGEYMNMYDNMPYTRDLAICDNEMIKMESGNVIKFYGYNVAEPFGIGGDEKELLHIETMPA